MGKCHHCVAASDKEAVTLSVGFLAHYLAILESTALRDSYVSMFSIC